MIILLSHTIIGYDLHRFKFHLFKFCGERTTYITSSTSNHDPWRGVIMRKYRAFILFLKLLQRRLYGEDEKMKK